MTTATITLTRPLDVATQAAAAYQAARDDWRTATDPSDRDRLQREAGAAVAEMVEAIRRLGAERDADVPRSVEALFEIRALLAGPRYPSGGDLTAALVEILGRVPIPA